MRRAGPARPVPAAPGAGPRPACTRDGVAERDSPGTPRRWRGTGSCCWIAGQEPPRPPGWLIGDPAGTDAEMFALPAGAWAGEPGSWAPFPAIRAPALIICGENEEPPAAGHRPPAMRSSRHHRRGRNAPRAVASAAGTGFGAEPRKIRSSSPNGPWCVPRPRAFAHAANAPPSCARRSTPRWPQPGRPGCAWPPGGRISSSWSIRPPRSQAPSVVLVPSPGIRPAGSRTPRAARLRCSRQVPRHRHRRVVSQDPQPQPLRKGIGEHAAPAVLAPCGPHAVVEITLVELDEPTGEQRQGPGGPAGGWCLRSGCDAAYVGAGVAVLGVGAP